MLGLEAQRRLKDFFMAVADGERDLEAARCRLCNIPDFAPRSAFTRIDRDASGRVSNLEICQFLRDNGIHHVSESEAFNLVAFFDSDGNSRLTFDEWVQMNLPCEDNYLRDRTMGRFAPTLMRSEMLPRDIELAMCDVIEKEIALQRNLDALKIDLSACLEYSAASAFSTVDIYRQGALSTVNINEFLRSQGVVATELDLVAIIRRIDTDGSCTLSLPEFSEFMRPLPGVKPVLSSPPRTRSTKYSSPVRVRTSASLLESPIALARSFSVERRVPAVTYISPSLTRWDLDYPVYKYRYLNYPINYSLVRPTYKYTGYRSQISPYVTSAYGGRSYWSTALGRYVAL